MTTVLRPELEALPSRMQTLPMDERGYPVPWFVAWENGQPEFRAMDPRKFVRAIKEKRCWVCGQELGRHITFPIGPMCALNRTISEPPSHYECAAWSARNCPFLSRPHMVRREDEVLNEQTHLTQTDGAGITRNPGVVCLWTTRSYKIWKSKGGASGYLITIGDPERVEWLAEGRPATREEVAESIDSGVPHLIEAAGREETLERRLQALNEIAQRRIDVEVLLP